MGHGQGLAQGTKTRLVGEELAALCAAPPSDRFINQIEALEERVAERVRGIPLHQGVFYNHRAAAVSVPIVPDGKM